MDAIQRGECVVYAVRRVDAIFASHSWCFGVWFWLVHTRLVHVGVSVVVCGLFRDGVVIVLLVVLVVLCIVVYRGFY